LIKEGIIYKLDQYADYGVSHMEFLVQRDISTKQALLYLGFKEEDFPVISKKDIESAVHDKNICNFLISRNNLDFRF
jgi:hypothetical protein